MRKFNLFFSRFLYISLAIILQVGLTVYFAFYLQKLFFYFFFIVELFALIFAIKLLNKNSNSVTKTSWIVLILAFPFVGVSVYFLFGKDSFSNKKQEKYAKIDKKFKNLSNFKAISQNYKQILNNYFDLSSFVYSVNNIPPFSNSDVRYLRNGEEYFNSLINDLKNAKEFILLEYFIISKGKIWTDILDILKDKIKEKVEVYIIYDDLGSISYLEHNFNKKLQKIGINCLKFNKFVPITSIFQNIRDHKKLCVIDNKVAYCGGINIGDEYANIISPLKYWKDSGVRIEGSAVSSFTVMFFKMWFYAKKDDFNFNINKNLIKHISNSNGLVQPFYSSPNALEKTLVAQNIYKYLINNSKKYIHITSPYIVVDYGLINDLIFAVRRGVDVRIVIPCVPDKKLIYFLTRQNVKQLVENGIKIYLYSKGFIHSKNIVCDGNIAVVGSVNFDYRSFLHQFENGVILYGCEAINDIEKDFIQIFKVSKLLDKKKIKNNFITRIIEGVLKIIAPLL